MSTPVATHKPWTHQKVDGWWCVYSSTRALLAKFIHEGDCLTYVHLAGPRPLDAELERAAAEIVIDLLNSVAATTIESPDGPILGTTTVIQLANLIVTNRELQRLAVAAHWQRSDT